MARDPFRSEELVKFTGDNIGDFLLNVLTQGLYNKPDLIVREYIQNSHDAICTWTLQPLPGTVHIQISWPNIHIFDNGPGMSKDELLQAMSSLGKSFKTLLTSSGFMGIGKLAGISMASRVEIHSSKYGIPEKNWVAFESAEMLEGIMERRGRGEHHSIIQTLNEHTKANEKPLPEDSNSHYTAVHLLGVHENYRNKIEDINSFAHSIGLIAPVKQNPLFEHAKKIEDLFNQNIPNDYKPIEIFINGKPIYRPYVEGLSEPKEILVMNDEDTIIAYGWACLNTGSERYRRQISEESLRGIALTQRGIAIGSRSLVEEMGLYPTTGNLIYFRWYSGELYVTDPKIVVSADRTRIRQNQYTLTFIDKASKELKKLAKLAENWANQDNAETVVRESVQRVTEIEMQIKNQPLTSDRVPRILSELVKTKSDVDKKIKYVMNPETKKQVEEVERQVSNMLGQIYLAQSSKSLIIQDNMLPISELVDEQALEIELMSEISEDYTNIRTVILHDIPEKLDFSPRETQIYRTIIDSIAEVCGGKETEDFTKIAAALEAALMKIFHDVEIGVL